MTRDIQIGLYGRLLDPNRPGDPVDQRTFPYPAFTDLLFWPTAYIPFETVRVWVTCILALLTLASVPIWLLAMNWQLDWRWVAVIVLLVLSSYEALEGMYAGQIGLLVAFLLSSSVLALQRGRFFLSGFLMALTTVKPQATGLTILFLLLWSLYNWRARGRFFVGFVATMAVLVGASIAAIPHWISSWLHVVLAYHTYTRPPLVTEVLTSHLGPAMAGPATVLLTVLGMIAAIVLAWRNRTAATSELAFWMTLSIIVTITVIVVVPGQAVYDHLILLPGILLLADHRKEIRKLSHASSLLLQIGTLVLFWPWIAAFALATMRLFVSSSAFDSPVVFSLPIRAAAPLPFVVAALLVWMLRNSVRNSVSV
jgi:hypothetical protein